MITPASFAADRGTVARATAIVERPLGQNSDIRVVPSTLPMGILSTGCVIAFPNTTGEITFSVTDLSALGSQTIAFVGTAQGFVAHASSLLDVKPHAGSADPSFGSGGIASIFNVAGRAAAPTDVHILPDRRIFLSGYSGTSIPVYSNDHFFLARLTSGGQPDLSFGTGGYVEALPGQSGTGSWASALDAQGRYVLTGIFVGSTSGFIAVARFLDDGTPDSSFGVAGEVLIPAGWNNRGGIGSGIVVQPSGGIVVAAAVATSTWAFAPTLFRLDSTGAIDPTFGTAGTGYAPQVLAPIRSWGALTEETSGELSFAAYESPLYTPSSISIARYTADGVPVASFGTGGVARNFSNGGSNLVVGVARRPLTGGDIVGGAYYYHSYQVAAFDATGTPDASFGSLGEEIVPSCATNQSCEVYALAVDSDGRSVEVGTLFGGGTSSFLGIRFDADGTPDATFSLAPTTGNALAARFDSDGTLLVAGSSPSSAIVRRVYP